MCKHKQQDGCGRAADNDNDKAGRCCQASKSAFEAEKKTEAVETPKEEKPAHKGCCHHHKPS